MTITATELKMNINKYLALSQTEDIYITLNNKVIAKLSNPYADKVEAIKSTFGAAPGNITLKEALDDRANNI